jgi:hypothetical protein
LVYGDGTIRNFYPTLHVLSAALPVASTGLPYADALSAGGAIGAGAWSLVSGSLPSGLTLGASGRIAGVPQAPTGAGQPAIFGVQVTDSAGRRATAQLALAVDAPNSLGANGSLVPGASIWSPSRAYHAVMQGDGNFVEYQGPQAVWATGTGSAGSSVAMQSDGNLVVYGPGGNALWSSGTSGHPAAAFSLAMQDDGNLVIYTDGGSAIWSRATGVIGGSPSPGVITAPIQVTGPTNIRPGPSTISGGPLGVMPTGTSPGFICWTTGEVINGVDVWFKISWNGVTGYYASGLDNSTYSSDAQITSKYGIPQCGSSGGGGGGGGCGATAPECGAVAWAQSFVGKNDYAGLCLTFVFKAYAAAGVNLWSLVTVPIGSNTYPVDIWGHLVGQTGGGTPPYGALVFFASATGDRTLSHVALSTGGGNLISTTDGVNDVSVHVETMAQHSYARYLGWWLPA